MPRAPFFSTDSNSDSHNHNANSKAPRRTYSPSIRAKPRDVADQANRTEPFWLREHLDLPADLPVHFVDEKTVTATDLDAGQSRFRLPTQGVLRNLRPILTAKQLQAANLRYEDDDDVPLSQLRGSGRGLGRRGSAMAAAAGCPCLVVDVSAGIVELEMSHGHGTSVKGEGYMDFITDCSFTVGDVVQIWAFNPRFNPLCLVINKIPQKSSMPPPFAKWQLCSMIYRQKSSMIYRLG